MWCGRIASLKHLKVLKNIKIVKQHAPKRLLFRERVLLFLLFNDKKVRNSGEGFWVGEWEFGVISAPVRGEAILRGTCVMKRARVKETPVSPFSGGLRGSVGVGKLMGLRTQTDSLCYKRNSARMRAFSS